MPNREFNKSLDAVELKESVKNLKSRKSTFLDEISNKISRLQQIFRYDRQELALL